jgi:hypothetical protein
MSAAAGPAPDFIAREITGVMVAGVIGVLIAGLQPQLLGALAEEGRLSAAQIGYVATIELLAMGLAAGVAGALLKPFRLRGITAIACCALALIDALTPLADAAGIIVARAAAGIMEGVLIWVAIGLIARMALPARWSGIYLAAQTLAQLALATLFAQAVIPAHGASGAFIGLALVSLAPLATLPVLPRAYPVLPRTDAPGGLPSLAGFVALAGVLFYLAFVVGVWVYIEPLAAQAGISPGVAAYAVPVSLGMQVAGASAATLFADRLRALPVILWASLANLVILYLLGNHPSATVLLVCVAAFGFLWLFILPFQVPIVIAADPTRRAAVLIAGAQLLGSSIGPLLASAVVSDRDVRGTLGLGAACIVVSLALITLVVWRVRPPSANAAEFA